MRHLLLIAFLVLLSNFGQGQTTGAGFIIYVGSAPSGNCSAGAYQENVIGLGTVYTCQSGTWTQVGGSVSLAFSAITAGTNSTAAMIIGTGASLTVSGSGTNTATGLTGSPAITVSSCTGCGGGTGTSLQSAYFNGTNTIGGYLAAGPDIPPLSANAMDDEFNSGTLNTTTLWTWQNQGTSTGTESKGTLLFTPQITNGADNVVQLRQAIPSPGPWTFAAKVLAFSDTSGAQSRVGLCMSDGTKIKSFFWQPGNQQYTVFNWTNATTFASTVLAASGSSELFAPAAYFAIQDDNTNWNYMISVDGVNYMTVATQTRNTTLTATTVGICTEQTSNTPHFTYAFDWARRTQ